MAIKRPAKYEHNNPNLPIIDVNNVWGGMFIMTGDTDQERFNIPVDKLKEHQLVKNTNGELWELTDIINSANINGWALYFDGENESPTSYWTAGTGINSGTAITTIANKNGGGDATGMCAVAEGSGTTASGNFSHAGGYKANVIGKASFIHSTNSYLFGDRSVLLGGQNLTGSTDDTVYVPYLNIDNVEAGTLEYNLGIDSDGKVIRGTTGSTVPVHKYANTHTFVANTSLTITHSLNDTDIIVQLKYGNELIIPDIISGYTSNAVDIKVSESGDYRVIILK